jgi:hypothetical protein
MSDLGSLEGILSQGGATVYRAAGGLLYIWNPAPGLFVTRIEGYFPMESVAAFEAHARRVAAEAGRIHAFHDWWDLTDYATDARSRLTNLGREQMKVSVRTHILLRSKLVSLAVNAASVFLPNITTYAAREPFAHALRAALAPARASVRPGRA